MSSIWWVSGVVLAGLAVLRLVRWVALAQQKEYRSDRMWSFLSGAAGQRELVRLVPSWSEVQTLGFRRPKLTARAVVTLLAVAAASALVGSFLFGALTQVVVSAVALSVAAGVLLLGMPLLVLSLALPPTLGVQLYAQYLLGRAAAKLRQSDAQVIGITGSFGKTSSKLLLAVVLGGDSQVFATPRSFNTRLSVARSILTGYKGQKFAIIECGAYTTGEIAAIAEAVQPSMAIITGFAPQHLGLFGSETAIQEAKRELVTAVQPGGTVVIGTASAERIVTSETRPDLARLRADQQEIAGSVTAEGYLELRYHANTRSNPPMRYLTQLVGLQYLDTVRTAWAVARAEGITPEVVLERITEFVPPAQFVQRYRLRSGALVIDDGGTANPAGFAAAVELLKQLKTAGKTYVVTPGIVDLGKKSGEIHERLAESIVALGASIWHVGEEGAAAFHAAAPHHYTSDQAEILTALRALTANDLLLIEGRMPAWFLKALTKERQGTSSSKPESAT